MTIFGWITMGICLTSVTVFLIVCLTKVLRTPNETEKMHGFEIDLPDKKDDSDE